MEKGRGNLVPVIDAEFCSTHAMNLLVKPEKRFLKSPTFNVLDANTEKQLLRIGKGDSHLKNKDWVIFDASDSILATVRRKKFSWHNVWRVYKGNNTQEEEALCMVKRQDKLILNVFIGSNQEEKEMKGDLDVVGFPPIVYMNDDIVANVNNNFSWGGDQRGKKGGLKVKVNGGIDYVFIVALIIIHREMAMTDISSSDGNKAVSGGDRGGANEDGDEDGDGGEGGVEDGGGVGGGDGGDAGGGGGGGGGGFGGGGGVGSDAGGGGGDGLGGGGGGGGHGHHLGGWLGGGWLGDHFGGGGGGGGHGHHLGGWLGGDHFGGGGGDHHFGGGGGGWGGGDHLGGGGGGGGWLGGGGGGDFGGGGGGGGTTTSTSTFGGAGI